MQHTQKMVLVSPDLLSRAKDPRPVSSETVTRSKLDQELLHVLDDMDLVPYDKVQRYNQILQRYLTFYDQTTKRPLTVKLMQEKTTAPITLDNEDQRDDQQPQAQDMVETTKDSTPDHADRHTTADKLTINFPVTIKNKAKTLFNMIKDSKGLLDFNAQGELLVEGRTIRGSHISDLVYDVLMGKSSLEPQGMEQFLSGLVRLNVPERLIVNKTRRSILRQMKQSTPPRRKPGGVTSILGKRGKSSRGVQKSTRTKRVGRLNWETYN